MAVDFYIAYQQLKVDMLLLATSEDTKPILNFRKTSQQLYLMLPYKTKCLYHCIFSF